MAGPILTIDQGQLRGSIRTTVDGVKYYNFQGIPYAQPPIGELRFKAPVRLDSWTGVLDATKEGSSCYNSDFFLNNAIEGNENCLFINVYTKEIGEDVKLKPVLFWIHGGGLVFGSSSERVYSPDFLLNEDVVLVTFNYRLGIFGFLAFEEPSLGIPGNAGFKDMVLALQWVQKNIAKFGGDPRNVTIFGESAGAGSVHLLLFSPLAKGLFHKAIAQSGVSNNTYPKGDYIGKRFPESFGLPSDQKTLFNELSKKTTEELFEIQMKLLLHIRGNGLRNVFGYIVEDEHPGAFLVKEPINALIDGNYHQVPLIYGFNNEESAIMTLLSPSTRKEVIPWSFGYAEGSPEQSAATDKMNTFYESGKDNLKLTDLLSDVNFVFGIVLAAKLQAITSSAPVYLYRMEIDTSLNFLKALANQQSTPGAFHSDDLGYLFKNYKTPAIIAGSLEDISRRRFVRLWTNFAKFGEPTPRTDPLLNVKWKSLEANKTHILNIGETLTSLSENYPEAERMKFWYELYRESPSGSQLLKKLEL